MLLDVKLLTTTQQLFSGKSSRVVLPTENGIMEVLPHHVEFVVNLTSGKITVEPETGKTIFTSVTSGVAYKKNNVVTILTEDDTINS